MMFGKITIYTSSNKATIEQVEKRLAKRFTEVARRNISGKGIERLNETHESETQKSTSNSTKLSELERLAELYDKGYISDEEFSKAKRELFP